MTPTPAPEPCTTVAHCLRPPPRTATEDTARTGIHPSPDTTQLGHRPPGPRRPRRRRRAHDRLCLGVHRRSGLLCRRDAARALGRHRPRPAPLRRRTCVPGAARRPARMIPAGPGPARSRVPEHVTDSSDAPAETPCAATAWPTPAATSSTPPTSCSPPPPDPTNTTPHPDERGRMNRAGAAWAGVAVDESERAGANPVAPEGSASAPGHPGPAGPRDRRRPPPRRTSTPAPGHWTPGITGSAAVSSGVATRLRQQARQKLADTTRRCARNRPIWWLPARTWRTHEPRCTGRLTAPPLHLESGPFRVLGRPGAAPPRVHPAAVCGSARGSTVHRTRAGCPLAARLLAEPRSAAWT